MVQNVVGTNPLKAKANRLGTFMAFVYRIGSNKKNWQDKEVGLAVNYVGMGGQDGDFGERSNREKWLDDNR